MPKEKWKYFSEKSVNSVYKRQVSPNFVSNVLAFTMS